MKKTITLILIFSFVSVFSQTKRFIYSLQINKKEDTVKVYMALDIQNDVVKFYDYEFAKQDSIRKETGSNIQYHSESEQSLIRKANTYENRMFFPHRYDYFVISSNDKINWKLENEIKKIEKYTLQKATTNFGGRIWTAWFSSEIPFQEGPYKFRGLSGLIFEIYDSENIFHYNLVRSINLSNTFKTDDFLETRYGKKPIAITLKQYQQIKLDYFNNIIEILNGFREKGGSIEYDKELGSKEDIAIQKKNLQNGIRNYYLPIEKDKAILYPKK